MQQTDLLNLGYPDPTDHTRVWEYFAGMAEHLDAILGQHCKVRRTSAQVIESGGGELVTWQASPWQVPGDAAWWNSAVSATNVIIPGTGRFDVRFHGALSNPGAAAGERHAAIQKNGVTFAYRTTAAISNRETSINVVAPEEEFTIGDVITVYVQHNQGANLNLTDAALSVRRLPAP